MKTKFRLCIIPALLMLSVANIANAGACNSSGCWNMKVKQWKVTSETGVIWIRFEDSGTTALDNIDPQNCIPRTAWWGAALKSMKISPQMNGYDELKQLVLTSYMFDDQLLAFGAYDPDPKDSNKDCEFRDLSIITTGS